MSKTEATVNVTLAEYDDMREELTQLRDKAAKDRVHIDHLQHDRQRLRKEKAQLTAQLDAVRKALGPHDALKFTGNWQTIKLDGPFRTDFYDPYR